MELESIHSTEESTAAGTAVNVPPPPPTSSPSPTSILSEYLVSTYGDVSPSPSLLQRKHQLLQQQTPTTNYEIAEKFYLLQSALQDDAQQLPQEHGTSKKQLLLPNKVLKQQFLELTRHFQETTQALEAKLRAAEQEATRQTALALICQDDLRRLQKQPNNTQQQEQQRVRREVLRERDTLLALQKVVEERNAFQEMAVQAEKRVVALQLEQEQLQRRLQEQTDEQVEQARRKEECARLEATNRILRQRLAVAEAERNQLRRQCLEKRMDP